MKWKVYKTPWRRRRRERELHINYDDAFQRGAPLRVVAAALLWRINLIFITFRPPVYIILIQEEAAEGRICYKGVDRKEISFVFESGIDDKTLHG